MKSSPFFRSFIFNCISILLAILFSNKLLSQIKEENKSETVNFALQIRPRTEIRNGVFTPILINQKAAAFVTQRNRLGITYSKQNQLTAKLNLQMLNVWGNDPQVQLTGTNLSLFEAWANINLSKTSHLKVGRQIFSYDDERILGALDWHNAGRKHDAALFQYKKGKIKADIAYAFNQNSEKVHNTFFNDSLSQPYKHLQFAWLNFKASDSLSFSGLLLNQKRQRISDSLFSSIQLFGVNTFYKTPKTSVTATIYIQTGCTDLKTLPSQKTIAWVAAIYGNYAITKKNLLGGGSEYLSGKDMDYNGTKFTAFNPLYGTHHKFYGYMDYFYVASPHRNTGLWDNYLNLTFKPNEKTGLQFTVHHFISPVKIINNQGIQTSSYLGNEVDLTFNYEINKAVKLIGGYSQLLPGNSMKFVKNISDSQKMKSFQNWGWLSVLVTPEINF